MNANEMSEAANHAVDLAQHWQRETEYWRTLALKLIYGEATEEEIQELRRQNPSETRIPNDPQNLSAQDDLMAWCTKIVKGDRVPNNVHALSAQNSKKLMAFCEAAERAVERAEEEQDV